MVKTGLLLAIPFKFLLNECKVVSMRGRRERERGDSGVRLNLITF